MAQHNRQTTHLRYLRNWRHTRTAGFYEELASHQDPWKDHTKDSLKSSDRFTMKGVSRPRVVIFVIWFLFTGWYNGSWSSIVQDKDQVIFFLLIWWRTSTFAAANLIYISLLNFCSAQFIDRCIKTILDTQNVSQYMNSLYIICSFVEPESLMVPR